MLAAEGAGATHSSSPGGRTEGHGQQAPQHPREGGQGPLPTLPEEPQAEEAAVQATQPQEGPGAEAQSQAEGIQPQWTQAPEAQAQAEVPYAREPEGEAEEGHRASAVQPESGQPHHSLTGDTLPTCNGLQAAMAACAEVDTMSCIATGQSAVSNPVIKRPPARVCD